MCYWTVLSTKRKPSILRVESWFVIVGFKPVLAFRAFRRTTQKTLCPHCRVEMPTEKVFGREYTATLGAPDLGLRAGVNEVGGGGGDGGGGVAHGSSIRDRAVLVKGSGTHFYFFILGIFPIDTRETRVYNSKRNALVILSTNPPRWFRPGWLLRSLGSFDWDVRGVVAPDQTLLWPGDLTPPQCFVTGWPGSTGAWCPQPPSLRRSGPRTRHPGP